MRFSVRRRARGKSYRAQIAEYRRIDLQLSRALSRGGKKVRTEIVKELGARSGYPARLLKRHFRYWSPTPNDARLQWTAAPHEVDRLGWVGKFAGQKRAAGKLRRGKVRVKKWPGTGGAKWLERSWEMPNNRLFSRHGATKAYRVKARGVRRLMREYGLRQKAESRFVGEVRARIARVMLERGGA